MRFPRTSRDFIYLDCWIWSDFAVDQIFNRFKEEWRSEVVTVQGKLHCAICLQSITINVCLECGQTIYDER